MQSAQNNPQKKVSKCVRFEAEVKISEYLAEENKDLVANEAKAEETEPLDEKTASKQQVDDLHQQSSSEKTLGNENTVNAEESLEWENSLDEEQPPRMWKVRRYVKNFGVNRLIWIVAMFVITLILLIVSGYAIKHAMDQP